jgi:xylan 1,4-beta-xylosidase
LFLLYFIRFVSLIHWMLSTDVSPKTAPAQAREPHAPAAPKSSAAIEFSALAEAVPLSHYWSVCSTAGRANEGLRAGWREHFLLAVKHCGFRYLRFHGLFHDDMFVCRRLEDGSLLFNWQYVDDLFDALLAEGVRPFVEFSFFPKDLAGKSDFRCFWWQAHVTPPDDYADWTRLVEAAVRHFLQRYGNEEVRQWYFEVWNEPNLWFFFNSTKSRYFELYRATAKAVKAVDPALRVGGPATSNFVPDDRFDGETQAGDHAITHELGDLGSVEWNGIWIKDFLTFCANEKLPVDFISTHPYPTDIPFGHDVTGMRTRPTDSTLKDLQWLRRAVQASAFPDAEIHLTEWNSSPSCRDLAHDFPQAAAFVIKANIESTGLVDSLAYWTFTDVVEEHGAGDTAFHGGFGLINYQGIAKPAFHAYRFLHQLGTEEIFRAEGFLATRAKAHGHVRAVVCHYPEECPTAPPFAVSFDAADEVLRLGVPLTRRIVIRNLPAGSPYLVETVDEAHGFAGRAWDAMGRPASPSRDQIALLRDIATGARREIVRVDDTGTLQLELMLAPWAIALIREMQ